MDCDMSHNIYYDSSILIMYTNDVYVCDLVKLNHSLIGMKNNVNCIYRNPETGRGVYYMSPHTKFI